MRFRDFLLSEARVAGSGVAEAMRRTLEFKLDVEWLSWDYEHPNKGLSPSVHLFDPSREFYLGARFRTPEMPGRASFLVRARAILSRADVEYDSVSGGADMNITAEMFLETPDRVLLSRRSHPRPGLRPTKMSKFDGPPLKTPLQLADWVARVAGESDIGDGGDDDGGPSGSGGLDPQGREIVGV